MRKVYSILEWIKVPNALSGALQANTAHTPGTVNGHLVEDPLCPSDVGDIPECSPMGRGQTERLFCVLGNLQKFSPPNRTENGVILRIYDPYVETLGRSKGVACREV